jgi:hypothetical protein
MKAHYETVGDVRNDVDAAFADQGLQTTGGSFYHNIRSLTFGLADRAGNRVGDAHCLLPEGGWQSNSYSPEYVGDPSSRNDRLRLSVIRGAGRLAIPTQGEFCLIEGSDMQLRPNDGRLPYHLVNNGSDLLITHARSTLFPSNLTDINPSGSRVIDDILPLTSTRVFTYDETFQADGSVDFKIVQ